MGYRNLSQCVEDLERTGQLVRIDEPIDAHLEAAAIHRRVHAAGGPAIYFAKVRNCSFPMVSNLFGTMERTRFLFRDALRSVEQLVELKSNPQAAIRRPWQYLSVPASAAKMLPRYVRTGPAVANTTSIGALPRLQSWPHDGGPFVTLPIVYTEDIERPGLKRSNLGMYRVQLAGNDFSAGEEVGLHYQIHRSIGVHHATAIRAGKPFRVNVFVGGPPAMMVAAVMPLPEGMSELSFAGALGGRRIRMIRRNEGLPIHAECDFCISGAVENDRLLPEGPFGDHLGYYSLKHPFPVMKVDVVHHRDDAIWPFTVVGRPPQEDTMFGKLIHELTGPLIPSVLPGVKSVHAVDAAGVHPLLLAVGSERYMPFLANSAPQELLTQANAILGQGQLSLAKFLLIAAQQDDPQLSTDDVAGFIQHVLKRADWRRDLHFQTQTTIDTLDYSGGGLNAGSKLVIAAAGPARFETQTSLPATSALPDGYHDPRVALPGVVVLAGPPCPKPTFEYDASPETRNEHRRQATADMERFCRQLDGEHPLNRFRWIVIVDDSQFASESLNNFLWVAFTRTNPADDVYGVDAFTSAKHWGCRGALVIDARVKSHHAPVLEEDPDVSRRVDELAASGGPLHGVC